MKTILVWFLVTYGQHGVLSYSPMFETVQECQRVQSTIFPAASGSGWTTNMRATCVQMTVVVSEKK